MCNQKNL